MARFAKFIMTEIFPGGRLPSIEKVADHSARAGFTLTRRQSLQQHYARTLDLWAEALEGRRDEAIEIQSEEVYERYMKYLTGCAKAFRMGSIDVNQFTLESSGRRPEWTPGRSHSRKTGIIAPKCERCALPPCKVPETVTSWGVGVSHREDKWVTT